MTLTAGQQAELEKPVTRFAYFAELKFKTATSYVCSLGQTVTWGGHDWIGLGSIGGITPIEEAQGTTSSQLTFQLNLAQADMLYLSVVDPSEYRGRDANLYFCPLNEQFQLVDTPVICWRGTMDTMQSSVTGKAGESKGTIALKCETSAYGLKRRPALRMNSAMQKQRYPNDTGFDLLAALIAKPVPWLSVKFQQK